MKTTNEKSVEQIDPAKQNSLRYKLETKGANSNDLTIEIKLADDCKNGHNDFSMTGSIYFNGKRGIERYFIGGGCIHKEILAAHPEFKIFADLHLSDAKGVPMYAVQNGYYHLRESGLKACKDYLRLTDKQAKLIEGAEDEKHFKFLLDTMNIPDQWLKEAKEAIKILEGLTGCKFEDDSKKVQYTPLSDEDGELISQRIKEGYYSEENKAARKIVKEDEILNNKLRELKATLTKQNKEARDEYNIKKAVLLAGLPLDNFIYYSHTNEGCFNWHTNSFNKAVTPEQFEQFTKIVDMSKLPKELVFKLNDK